MRKADLSFYKTERIYAKNFDYPVLQEGIDRGRLRDGVELRRVRVLVGGNPQELSIFMPHNYSLSGRQCITIVSKGHTHTLTLATPVPKKIEAQKPEEVTPKDILLTGIPASPGFGIGQALLWLEWEKGMPIKKYEIAEKDIPAEKERFRQAVKMAIAHYESLGKEVANGEHDRIYQSFVMILQDEINFLGLVERGIENRPEVETESQTNRTGLNAEYVVEKIINDKVAKFEEMTNEYWRQMASDLRDIGRILQEKLQGKESRRRIEGEEIILVTEELGVSDLGEISRAKAKIIALVTAKGGPTGHAAIIAKSMRIPGVVGLDNITHIVKNGDLLIVDGRRGQVIFHPSQSSLDKYLEERDKHDTYSEKLNREVEGKKAQTADGHRVYLKANILSPHEIGLVRESEADGIGLFRTEGEIDLLPREGGAKELQLYEDQEFERYRMLKGLSVELRSLDLGGDKLGGKNLSVKTRIPLGANPFLGVRGIRVSYHNEYWQNIFRAQVRAGLRASEENRKLSIMFPMVSDLWEFAWAKQILEAEKEALSGRHIKFNPGIKVGVMVEVPSLLAVMPKLAKMADFFSFGSNDMIQYIKAADRTDEHVAYLYDPFHFSLVWSLKRVIEAAHSENKPVTVCGDMGADPLAFLLLVGLGVDGISMIPSEIPAAKYVLLALDYKQAKDFVEKAYDDREPLILGEERTSNRDRLKKLVLEEFPLEVTERINLVEARFSPRR